MQTYTDQPSEKLVDNIRLEKIKDVIQEVLEEELPECDINAWFIDSVHFANMLDRAMEKIWAKA